jgi:hypothetical protein
VAERVGAGLGVVERVDGFGHVLRVLGHSVDDGTPGCAGRSRATSPRSGVLHVPFGSASRYPP